MALKLYPHQEKCKQLILNKKEVGLFMDCGTGKTLATLSALEELNLDHHVLIVAPKIALVSTWVAEIEKWGFNLKPYLLTVKQNGTVLNKAMRLKRYGSVKHIKTPSVFLASTSLIKELVEFYGDEWQFKTVVIDEIHDFKNCKAVRSQSMIKVRPQIERMIGLTGTPIANTLEDLYGIMRLIDDGERLGKNLKDYHKEYFRINPYIKTPTGKLFLYEIVPGAEKTIYDKIDDITVSVKNTVIDMPTLNLINYFAKMEDKEMKLYNHAIKELVVDLKKLQEKEADEDDFTDEFIIRSKADLANKLHQMAQGHLYKPRDLWEDYDRMEYEIIHDKKLTLLGRIIKNSNQHNLIVVYNFKSDLERIKGFLEKEMKFTDKPTKNNKKPVFKVYDGKDDTKKAWNKGEYKILLVQPKSASVSLNLQEGGSTMIWFSLTYSANDYTQTCARIYRNGQTKPVNIFHLIMKDTIDEHILSVIQEKRNRQDDLLKALRLELNKWKP